MTTMKKSFIKRPELMPTPESFVKKTMKNGRVIYIHPAEGRVSHTKLTLYDTLNLHFGALRSVLDFMDDETNEKFGTLLEIVIQNAENHVDKVFELLEKDADIKNIEVHVVRRGNSFWRPGWVAGLTITKKGAVKKKNRPIKNAENSVSGDKTAARI